MHGEVRVAGVVGKVGGHRDNVEVSGVHESYVEVIGIGYNLHGGGEGVWVWSCPRQG